MTQLTLRIAARPNGTARLVQALNYFMVQTKLQPGCVDCQIYAEAANPQSLLYMERWATQQDAEAELRSQRFGTLLSIMETAPAAPTLEICTVSEQRGLEYVEALRLEPRGAGRKRG